MLTPEQLREIKEFCGPIVAPGYPTREWNLQCAVSSLLAHIEELEAKLAERPSDGDPLHGAKWIGTPTEES